MLIVYIYDLMKIKNTKGGHMRNVFIILLGLSLAAIAQDIKTSPQITPEKVSAPLTKEENKESKPLCNPKEVTKMPETFY